MTLAAEQLRRIANELDADDDAPHNGHAYTPSSASTSTSPCGECNRSRDACEREGREARSPRPSPVVHDPTNERLARCYERVLAGLPGESPVTVVEMLLIAKRIREGDHDGRLPDETGYVAPYVDPFPMFPI